MASRVAELMLLLKRNPEKESLSVKGIQQVYAMKLAGFSSEARDSKSSQYGKVSRRVKKLRLKKAEEAQNAANNQSTARIVTPLAADADEGNAFNFNEPPSSPAMTIDEFLDENFFWPLTYPVNRTEDPTVVDEKRCLTPFRSLVQIQTQNLFALTTTAGHRNTTAAAHFQRQQILEARSIRSSVFKAATLLYKGVVDGCNSLKAFDNPNKVANMFNNACRIELFSGNEIATAVERGNAGKSPPRRGRPSSIPEAEFKAFANALLTFSAIEQINCSDRTPRSHLVSLVGAVLNAKRQDDDEDPMQETSFFRRLEMENSQKQDLRQNDPREAHRVAWLTYATQKLNFERWEETVIEYSFAREKRVDDADNGEHIVWFEGQHCRVLQLDEMALFLDASLRGGGRPSHVPTSATVPESGASAPKGGKKVTVIHGINFAGEALPPYIQFPTDATNVGNYKLKKQLLPALPQVKARYGYSKVRSFDVGFGMNPKGKSSPAVDSLLEDVDIMLVLWRYRKQRSSEAIRLRISKKRVFQC
jgi:hypothetical protein